MRALIATAACLVVLSAAAVSVAQNVDTTDAEAAAMRARAAQLLADQADVDCGCTAGARAKDRMESRNTAEEAGGQ